MSNYTGIGFDPYPTQPFHKCSNVAPSAVPFFVIWRKFGNAPVVEHYSLDEAQKEMTRLAVKHPGSTFYCLMTLASALQPTTPVPPVVITPMWSNAKVSF